MSSALRNSAYLALALLLAAPAWPQADDPGTEETAHDRMIAPPPVSGISYSIALPSEERSNTLQYGVVFTPAYSDNVLGLSAGHPVSDVSYSVWPTIGLDRGTPRSHWDLTYAPGFTFYQRTSRRNQTDQNATLGFQYRLSPHVTFSAGDTFQKSSSFFNQPSLGSGSVSGGIQGPNDSIIAPLANQLRNYGNLGISYEYSASDMIGGGAGFANLYYPDRTQANGLWDSSSQSGSAFYTHRFSSQHYLGAAYAFQRLMSYPENGAAETQTHSIYLFYTMYPTARFSLSLFGGPQRSDTAQPAVLGNPAFSLRSWTPAAGASLDWQGHFVGAAISYAHMVSEGGGLIGAVKMDSANAGARFQLSPALTASVSGSYTNNNVIGYSIGSFNGHTFSGTAGLGRRIGDHFSASLGYTRMHQTYDVPAIAGANNTNRVSISFSYLFARPLGR